LGPIIELYATRVDAEAAPAVRADLIERRRPVVTEDAHVADIRFTVITGSRKKN
jgi:hypothetical protein